VVYLDYVPKYLHQSSGPLGATWHQQEPRPPGSGAAVKSR